ncbi:unnamed protein product [Lampetra fluviatilis]
MLTIDPLARSNLELQISQGLLANRENVTTSGFFMEPEPSPGGLNVTAGEAITIVIGCLVVLGSSISLLRYALHPSCQGAAAVEMVSALDLQPSAHRLDCHLRWRWQSKRRPGRISLNSAALGATPRAVCLVADLFASSSSWRRKQQQQRRAAHGTTRVFAYVYGLGNSRSSPSQLRTCARVALAVGASSHTLCPLQVLVDGGKPAAGAGGGDDLVAVNVPDIRRP